MRGQEIVFASALTAEACVRKLGEAVAAQPYGTGVIRPILARTRGASEFELWHNAVRTRNDFAPSLLLRIEGEGSGARLVCRLDFSPAAATFAKWMRPAAVVVGVYWMLRAGWVLIHSGLSALSPLGILLGATVIVLAWVGPQLAYHQASGDEQKLLGFVRHALAARERESGGG